MKKLILFVLALALLSGCVKPAESSPPEPSGQSSSQGSLPGENADIKTGLEFEPSPIEGAQTKSLEFSQHAQAKSGYKIDLLSGAEFFSLGGDIWSESYYITEPTGKGGMTVSLLSCPKEPIKHFDLSGEDALKNKLIAYIFPTGDRHRGQQNAVADFEYRLTVDHLGTREGWQAFIIEFEDDETATHSVRFLSANDDISEHYAGIAININLPMGETAAYESYMKMLHSLRRA